METRSPRSVHSTARSRSRAPSGAPTPIVVDMAGPSRPPLVLDAPGLSGGRGMFKRLIVACDGTWMNSDNGLINGKLSIPSNVTRISRAIKAVSQEGIPQIVNYHFGVGTQGGIVDRVVGGATGEGLGDTVREGYSFLANNYHPGDEIFLLGFSRGAFTARSIAGLVGQVGLLTKEGLHALPEVFKDVQNRRDPKYIPKNPNVPFPNKPSADDPRYADELERRRLTRLDIPIKVVGVWDTVGSLGTPRIGWLTKVGLQSNESKEMSFYDTKLSSNIENAFQALALDERRSAFAPAVWEKPEGNRTTLRQVWFPGTHSNVGGGYDDQQLANITLAWMMSQLEPFLDMRDNYLFEMDEENDKYYRKDRQDIRPWSSGEIYNSSTGIYALGGGQHRTPGLYNAVDPFTGRTTSRPLRQTNEYIHPSVRTRIRLNGPGCDDKGVYECRALTDNYKLVVDYGTSANKGDPDIFWKLKFKDKDGARVLPEAPLWRLERELCRKDPETYDYVKKPPVKGSRKSGVKRRSKQLSADMGTGRSRAGGGANRSSSISKEKRSRARSLDRETDIRESMPHRRPKDKAWWDGEGVRSPRRNSTLKP
ncbi:hypothetical protein K469DRAFT_731418 [Zopfia rhizophila CBS 207.26]|uniref:T6SS Phospholipase effector Tle1-like catalytic domain-containing protein n=1 Tax=Zopfia rhizophila CBS 207.26 TaxID=1314779 RepID=A0A6A6DI60_9PEZI|nr:hypothetical protein K469DRAFT_731418 [Zopfia rhizophila CBS 207.26]